MRTIESTYLIGESNEPGYPDENLRVVVCIDDDGEPTEIRFKHECRADEPFIAADYADLLRVMKLVTDKHGRGGGDVCVDHGRFESAKENHYQCPICKPIKAVA